MNGKRLPLLIAAVLPMGAPGAARADTPPSVWEVAADPGAARSWNLHVRVERLLEDTPASGVGEGELRLEAARAMLEDAGASRSPDVRLRFDLGIVYEALDLHRRAVDVLGPALDAAPDHPAAVRALSALAYAYAKMGDAPRELEVWRKYIPRIVNDSARATEMMNMGEAEMRLGRIEDALDTFHEVLRLCGGLPNTGGASSTYVLTLWDVAVALDRSGDPRGALETAARAVAWNLRGRLPGGAGAGGGPLATITGWNAINDTRTVFFVPEWERDWYLALGCASQARNTDDPVEAARWLMEAAAHRKRYVAGSLGAVGPDPWLAVAQRRASEADAAAVAALARVSRPGIPAGRRKP